MTATSGTSEPQPVGWRRIALIVAGCLFLLNLDSAIIATSLPQMAVSFGRRPVELSVAITAYILAGAAVMPMSGWLADRLGARPVLIGAIAVFTLASAACGIADSFWPFVLARIVQGAGGALMAPVGQAMVLRSTDRTRMIQAIGLVTWPSLIAPVLGPAVGGFITTFFSWRWNFWLNLPLGGLLAALVWLLLPNERAGQHMPLDLAGLALCSAAMVCLLTGLDTFSGGHSHSMLAAGCIAVGVGLGALAIRHLRRHPAPVLSLLPMRTRSFAASLTGPGLPFRAVFSATPFLLPLLFQLGFHLSAVSAGVLVLVYFCGNLVMKTLTTRIMHRVPFRPLLVVNGLLVAGTVLACGWLDPHMNRLALMAILFAAGVTRSLQFTALTTLSFADVNPAEKNAASTLSAIVVQGTMAAGVALAAFGLDWAQHGHSGAAATPHDFRLLFQVLGGVTAVAALGFLRLPADAGERVRAAAGAG